jgi:putative ABC transport system permease protein
VGIITSMQAAVANPARTGDPWDVAVSPASATAGEIEGVLAGTPGIASWYTLTDERATMDGRTFRVRAVGGEPGAARYVIGGGRAATQVGEATVGWGFLGELGVRVGDRITFDLGGTPVAVTIVGWHRDTTDSGVTLLWRDEQRRQLEPDDPPTGWRITTADGARPDDVREALAASLGPGARVRTFEQGTDFAPFTAAMVLLASLGAVVALLFLTSSAITRVRERAREIGVRRALGFTDGRLLSGQAAAAALVAVPAAAIGVPLGLLVLRVVSDAITEEIGAGPGFVQAPGWPTLLLIGLAAVALACAAGVLGIVGVLRRSTSSLVRYE